MGLALVSAGCLGESDAPTPDTGETPAEEGRIARGGRDFREAEVATVPGPETLYFRWAPNGDYLSPDPDPYPLEGSGFSQGGTHCPVMVFPAPFVNACWGTAAGGSNRVPHLAGDSIHIAIWLHGEPPPTGSVALKAALQVEEEMVAEGVSESGTPTTGTPVPGPDGCTLFEVDLVLPADLPAESALVVELRAEDLWGSECTGGGEHGNRIEFAVPPGAPS